MASLHRDEANDIFKNNRLLVGLLEHENQRTEAWLGMVLSSGGAGGGTGWWRIYTYPNGSELLTTAMRQLHPALQAHSVGGNVKAYFSMSTMEQVAFLAGRKAPQRQEQNGSEKRKRDSSSLEDSAKDKKAKVYAGYYNDSNKADDEKPPPRVNRESTEMSAFHQIPTVLGAANLDAQQCRPLHSQSQDQISAFIANLGLAENVVPSEYKAADQNHNLRGALKPDPTAVTTLAHNLQKVLVCQVIEWAKCGEGLKRDLKEPAGELCVAENIGEILLASEKILQHLSDFHKHVEDVRFKEKQYFAVLGASGIPVNTLPEYDPSVMKSEGLRRELKVVVEKMTQRIHELQTGMM